jgi:hypothetical protein
VVTGATASRYRLRTISDLARAAPGLVFGGPPECPERPDCLPGLRRTYGLRFRAFAALDAGGPLTRQALEGGDIGAALLFSTDPAIRARHLVELADNRDLQPAENQRPVGVLAGLRSGRTACGHRQPDRQVRHLRGGADPVRPGRGAAFRAPAEPASAVHADAYVYLRRRMRHLPVQLRPGCRPLAGHPVDTAVAFEPRADLVRHVRRTEGLALCGRGAAC